MKILVNSMAWVPKGSLDQASLNRVRNRLTIWPKSASGFGQDDPPPIRLYKETKLALGVPRGFFEENMNGNEDIVVACSEGHPMSNFENKMRFEGPFKEQGDAIECALDYCSKREWGGFLLKAGCGFGKTNFALSLGHRLGRSTLILVHKEFFLAQWRDRIREFMPDAKIGLIQGSTCDYVGKDFTIAMMQSLARDDGTKYPKDMYSAFGLIVSDECHRIGAQTWADLIPRFNAKWRLGLTATPRRKDGSEGVFFKHIGQILYSASSQSMIPKLSKCFTDFEAKPHKSRGRVTSVEKLTHVQLVSQLVEDHQRNRTIADTIISAYLKNRKVMVISERKKHLDLINDAILDLLAEANREEGSRLKDELEAHQSRLTIDYYVGGRKEAELEEAERAMVVLATKQMVEEGLDIPAIDVLILATPLGDVEQTVGRVRRFCKPSKSKCPHLCPWRSESCEGKPEPVVIDVIDRHNTKCRRKYLKRHEFYKEIGMV